MILPCVCCGQSDALTNAAGLFCHGCSENASELAKDMLFQSYVSRMTSLHQDMEDWEKAA